METNTTKIARAINQVQGLLQRLVIASLILLFFYTSVSKLTDLEEFRGQLFNQVIPAWSVAPLLWFLPIAELSLSVMLIFERTRKIALCGVAFLMSVFTTYMALVLLQVFPRVPCSCGGVLKSMSFAGHFLFNLFFLVLSVSALSQQESRR